jgi:hypothetical protein
MVPPTGGATARWTGFEQRNRFFQGAPAAPPLFPRDSSPKTLQHAACVLSCCPEAHLVFTEFPPSLGHMDRMNELLDLEIGWARTRLGYAKTHYPCKTKGLRKTRR